MHQHRPVLIGNYLENDMTPYTAHVTMRDQTVRRVEIESAPSRAVASQMAQALMWPSAISASANPINEAPRKTTDCCSYRSIVGVSDSAFGDL